MTELRTGATLGPYELQRVLGHGGMATVYQARQSTLDRAVALKVLSTDLARDPQFVARFQREARTAASLEHANIVQIFDVGQVDGTFYIAMRYVAGVTLAQLLEREGRLSLERAIRLLAQIASALDYAHQRADPVIHRDLKPGNVLVENGDRATLVDFGIAQASSATRLTRLHSIIGTPEYMAPEQIEGREILPATDLYALGIMAYELLAGREPFRADAPTGVLYQHVHAPMPPLRPLRPDIPEYVESAIRRMLSKNPQDRFRSGEEFIAKLSGQRVASSAPARRGGSVPWPVLVAGAAVLVVGSVALSAMSLGRESTSASPGPAPMPPPTTVANTAPTAAPTVLPTPLTAGAAAQCASAINQVDSLWSSNLGAAATLLEQARGADPSCRDGSGSITEKLYAAYLGLGQQYVDLEQSDLAIAQFDKAINLLPSRAEAPASRKLVTAYHDGLVARGQNNLDTSVERLSEVVRAERSYANGKALSALADVYMSRAGTRSAAGRLDDARADVDQVIALQPGNQAAIQFRDALQQRLVPPTLTPVPAPPVGTTGNVTLGSAASGARMVARRIGGGPIHLAITGSLHGGRERAAYQFLDWLAATLSSNPSQVPAYLTVYVLPTANPDDISRSTGFNLRGVDINRNFPPAWQAETCGARGGRYGPTGCKADGGGSSPLSEPESKAVQTLVQGQDAKAVLIVNSGLSVISSRDGGGGLGEPLARLLNARTSIPYVPTYTQYPVTGQLVDWVESLGKIGVEVNMPASFSNSTGLQVVQTVFNYLAP